MAFVPDTDAPAAPKGFVPDVDPTPLAGAAAVPGSPQDVARTTGVAPPPPAAPPAPATWDDKLTGAIKAGLDTAASVVGGIVGMPLGLAKSAAENLGLAKPTSHTPEVQARLDAEARGTAFKSSRPPTFAADEAVRVPVGAEEGMSKGAEAIASGLRNLPNAATGDARVTPQAEQVSQDIQNKVVSPVMENLMPLAGLHGSVVPHGVTGEGVARATGAAADAGGAAADAAANAGAKAVAKVVKVDPELAKVARTASELKYPIDVRPDQVAENGKFTRILGEASSDMPLSGSKNASNRTAFTRNVIHLLNPEEGKAERLTPDVFDDAMTRSGEGIGEITARTPVEASDLVPGLDRIKDDITTATDENQRIVSTYLGQLSDRVGEDGKVDGTALKELNSKIGAQARTNAGNDLGRYLSNLQDVIQDSVERHAAPDDIQPLRDFRRQYAYGKMLEPEVAKTIDGQISPPSLMSAVTRTKQGKYYMARAMGGPIGELAKVGKLIKEPASSGTAERALIYHGVNAAAGLAGAAIPANLYNRLGPKLTRRMIGKNPEPEVAAPPEPPPELTTSPGAAPEGGGPAPAAPAGPLGDLTPDWETSPGAAPPRMFGKAEEPGLVRAVDEQQPTTGNRKAPLEQPLVPGRPDLPDTLVSGGPAETAATDRSNAEMHSPGAIEARRQQAERGSDEPPNGGGGEGGGEPPEGNGGPPVGPSAEEAQRLLAENPSPAVRAVLEKHLKAEQAKEAAREKQIKNNADADALERTARTTTDPGLQKTLLEQADKLRATEKIPVGKVIEGQPEIKTPKTPESIPAGEATEITPERIEPPAVPDIPAGEATELTPEAEKEWRTKFGLNEQDAARAREVARALALDPAAVEQLAIQHERSPRAFDREISKINEKGEAHATETKSPREGGEGPAEADRARNGGDGSARVSAGEGDGAKGARPEDNGKPAEPVRRAAEPTGADGAAAPGASGKLEIREVPGGFEAYKDGKKIGYLKDNLERGQAKQLGENANVDIVKVDKDQQGTGVGRALYKAFEDKHEGNIAPSGKTEPSAWKVWKRNYPEKVDAFVKQEAARIRDGADPGLVARNITDAEVRSRVLKEAERGTDTKPDDQPGGLRKKDGGKAGPQADDPEEVFKASGADKGQGAAAGHPQGKPVGSHEAMDQVLRAKFGNKLIDGLQREGVLKYALSMDEGMTGDRRGVKAVYRGMQRRPAATLYVDRLTAEQAPGVLMHELGEHFGIVRMLGQERYGVMLSELNALKKSSPEVKEAWDHVAHNYTGEGSASRLTEGDPNFLREVAAHLVETHPDLPFVRRLINEIRAFFYEHFGTTMGNTVDADLVRGLAAAALRRASKGDLPKMKQPLPIRPNPMFAPRTQPGAAAP